MRESENKQNDRKALTAWLNDLVQCLQLKLARYLNHKCRRMPVPVLRRYVLVVLVLMVTIVAAVSFSGLTSPVTVPHSTKAPRLIRPMVQPQIDIDIPTSISSFSKHMDSLKVTAPLVYDSITTARPGLMDSIAAIRKLYQD